MESSDNEGCSKATSKRCVLETDPMERMHTLSNVTWDWKFHRDEVLMDVFKMCDKDHDDKLAGNQLLHILHVLNNNLAGTR